MKTLADAPGPIRTLVRWVTIVQTVGYTVALLFVRETTHLTPSGVADRYRGTDPALAEGSMQFAKSVAEMLTITHTHIMGLAAIFVVSGLSLAWCRRPGERWRRFLLAEPFAAILISFGSMLLMWAVHPAFAWLLIASSSTMAAVFYAQTYWILREVGFRESPKGGAP